VAAADSPSPARGLIRGLIVGGVTLGVILVALAVVVVISLASAPGTDPVTASGTGPANMASDGVVFTAGEAGISALETPARALEEAPTPTDRASLGTPAHIVLYVDYLCPICGAFEESHMPTLEQWIDDGIATVEIHPVAILDRLSLGTRYSTRAANAMACTVDLDPENAFAVHKALFAAQPGENTEGLSDEELLDVLAGAGASSDALTACVTEQRFAAWVSDATSQITANGIPIDGGATEFQGTPTVIVNGELYVLTQANLTDPSALAAYLNSQLAG